MLRLMSGGMRTLAAVSRGRCMLTFGTDRPAEVARRSTLFRSNLQNRLALCAKLRDCAPFAPQSSGKTLFIQDKHRQSGGSAPLFLFPLSDGSYRHEHTPFLGLCSCFRSDA